jgi:hypothetical protein
VTRATSQKAEQRALKVAVACDRKRLERNALFTVSGDRRNILLGKKQKSVARMIRITFDAASRWPKNGYATRLLL